MNKFVFYSDPSHGWLKVPMKELVRLGIDDRITSYSYFRGEYAYLEEDCDAGVFLKARVSEGRPISVIYRESEKMSRIRNYHRYGGPSTSVWKTSQNSVI